MENNAQHMNPDYPFQRGCWIDTRTDGKAVLSDYPTWREKKDPGNLPPSWNRNLPVADGLEWQKEFATEAEALKFAESENYVRCDMPARFRPRRGEPEKKSAQDPFEF